MSENNNNGIVLVVNDDPDSLEVTRLLCEYSGFSAIAADSGKSALEALRQTKVDLVLSDVIMPEIDGVELCRRIKAEPLTAEIPVLLVTALRYDNEGVRQGLQAGADDYLQVGAPVELLSRKVARLIAQRRERSARQEAEEALRRSEERFRSQYKGIPLPTYSWRRIDDDFELTDYNQAAETLAQGHMPEYMGLKASELFQEAPEVLRGFERCFEEQATIKGETWYRLRATGETRRFAIWYVFVAPDLVMVHTDDVTQRRQDEEAIRFQAHLLDMVGQSVIAADEAGRIVFWNRQSEVLYGAAAAEAIGRPPLDVIQFEPVGATAGEMLGILLGGGRWSGELLVRNQEGKQFPVAFTGTPIQNEQGELKGLVGISSDISEQKLLEQQLRQSQKMEAVGRLAGGIAHDFNNLLTAIIGYSQMVYAELRQGDPLRDRINEVLKAGQRAASLTSQLLAFSRKQVLQPKVLDLNVVVKDMDKMLRRVIGEDVELALALQPTLARVKADPGQIEQVLLNLAINARDAMPKGGKLAIETGEVEIDDEYAELHADAVPGLYVVLAVRDTGCGMDAQELSQIFEPFFTTKEQGRGTGLGLSTVYGIVKQSGGHVAVESEPGKGSVFKIFLPVTKAEADGRPPRESEAIADGASRTILVVEDDELVRKLTRHALESSGYEVLEASSGAEAILIYDQHPKPIDLVITDVVMPQMSGREFIQRLEVRRPDQKILYMSGYTDDAIVHHGVLDEERPFIQKPFTVASLTIKVRDLLK